MLFIIIYIYLVLESIIQVMKAGYLYFEFYHFAPKKTKKHKSCNRTIHSCAASGSFKKVMTLFWCVGFPWLLI
ncbi:hypothetical protein Hanom_Chr03g00251011 [Helianthus anomalus]